MSLIYISYDRNNAAHTKLAELLANNIQDAHEVILHREADLSAAQMASVQDEVQRADRLVFIFSNGAYASYRCYVEVQAATYVERRNWPYIWRKTHEPAQKIIPVLSSKADEVHIDTLMADLRGWPSTWEPDATRVAITELQAQVNVFNWVSFDNYHTATGTAQKEKELRLALYKVNSAIDELLPTWRAFLSYARVDAQAFVLPFKTALESDNIPVWFDADDIPSARNWLQEIYRGIEKSHNFLFVVSTAWLTSPNCHLEYDYARQYNKRIVPVIYEAFDEAACRQYLKNKPWVEGGTVRTDDYVLNRASAVWQAVQALPATQVHRVRKGEQVSTLAVRVQKSLNENRLYINKHTEYLVRAIAHQLGTGGLLRANEVPDARRWLNSNQDQRYPPSPAHDDFIRNSQRRMLLARIVPVTVTSFILLVIAGLAILFFQADAEAARNAADAQAARADAQAARADTEAVRADSALQLAAEADERLQVQAVYAEVETIPLPARGDAATIAAHSLWLVRDDDYISRFALNGLSLPVHLPVGLDPGQVTPHNAHVWVNNRGENTVTRVSTADYSTQSIEVGGAPLPPVFTDDGVVWVQSATDGTLTWFPEDAEPDATQPQQRHIGVNAGRVVAAGSLVAYLSSDGRTLHWLGAGDTDGGQVPLAGPAMQVLYVPESNRLMIVSSNGVQVFDPERTRILHNQALPKAIDLMQAAEGYVWAVFQDASGFLRFDPTAFSALGVNAPGVGRLRSAGGLIWAVGDTTLTAYDAITLEQQALAEGIGDAPRLLAPVSDGRRAWFVLPERDSVYVIHEATGEVERDLPLCVGPGPLQFDGARMWLTCTEPAEVMALPADIHFFGERTALRDLELHETLIMDDVLWLVQSGTGRVIAYDLATEQTRTVLNFNSSVTPLHHDGRYLWFGVIEQNRLVRLDPQLLPNSLLQPTDAMVATLPLAHAISHVTPVGEDLLWVQNADFESGAHLTIVNKRTFSIQQAYDNRLIGGVRYADGAVWSSSFDVQQAYIVRHDPQTGDELSREPMPGTRLGSYMPQLYDNLLWFVAVVPPPAAMMDMLLDMPPLYSDDFPARLIGIDPQRRTAVAQHPLPTWTNGPEIQGRLFWFLLMGNDAFGRALTQNNRGVVAIDIDTGQQVGPIWSVCDFNAGPEAIAGLVYLGCWDTDDTLGVVDPERAAFIARYDGLGRYPNEPLLVGDVVLLTFRDSGTAAVFDAATGQLSQTLRTGDRPYAPFVYNGAVWVYNAASDTLQRLHIQPTGSAAANAFAIDRFLG